MQYHSPKNKTYFQIYFSNEKLNIACIGCGGKGFGDINEVSSENIVALCDVDDERAADTFKNYPDVPKFKDFRRMLDKMDNQIDAVTVSTPDHIHYPAAMTAISMGKHVFVQKPLTHSIWEARQLTLAAKKYNVATHMGIQGHAMEGTKLLYEWINGGVIGKVREVHYWTNRPIWPQGIDKPKDRPPVPATLDWDLWLGPAQRRYYNPAYLPFKWRGWWDFGTGALGDHGCHAMDAAFWALNLGAPSSVEAVSSPINGETYPSWSIITYQFPARGEMPPVKVVWYDGGELPPRPKDLEEDREFGEWGQIIYGDKATVKADGYCESPRIIPESKMKELRSVLPSKTLPRSPGHYEEWIEACKGGSPAGANFDYAGPLTEMVLLGNIALATGEKIEWDSQRMRITNVQSANKYIRRKYRKGWEI